MSAVVPRSTDRPLALASADLDWLTEFLAVPSVSPLEGGDPAGLSHALKIFVDGARDRGFQDLGTVVPTFDELAGLMVPECVRRRRHEPGFLSAHQSAILRMGSTAPPQRRMVLNFHTDTVAPHIAPVRRGGTLYGRGVLDDKGPGVAAAVGIAAAFLEEPWLAKVVEVQLVAVPGEEGGALGVLGTRALVSRGHVGRLMVFAEPTSLELQDMATAAATARFEVDGDDATDDAPAGGHNATLALALIAEQLASRVVARAEALGATACLAGLHTGNGHNRVYGRGTLLLNLGYMTQSDERALIDEVEQSFAMARYELVRRHGDSPTFRRLVDEWDRVVTLTWTKRDVPPLANRDPAMEAVFEAAGIKRIDAVETRRAFTCDAIWAGGPDRYVAIYGPGDLAADGAHTDDEHIELDHLDAYATGVRDLVIAFGRHTQEQMT